MTPTGLAVPIAFLLLVLTACVALLTVLAWRCGLDIAVEHERSRIEITHPREDPSADP